MLPATAAQPFSDRQDFASALKTDDNRSATNSTDVITIREGFFFCVVKGPAADATDAPLLVQPLS
jgi:hypothetical protein